MQHMRFQKRKKIFMHNFFFCSRCFEQMELVQLAQSVKLPTLLIWNMLPLNSKGSKILSRINAEKKIRVYTIKGDYQIYTLSSCLVGGLIQSREVATQLSWTFQQTFKINLYRSIIASATLKIISGLSLNMKTNYSVEQRISFEADRDEYIYLLFYIKFGKYKYFMSMSTHTSTVH